MHPGNIHHVAVDEACNKLKQNVVFYPPVVSCYSGSSEQPTSSRLMNTGGELEGYVDNDLRANRQHDGKHRPPSFASFLHDESSRRKAKFEITLYGYFLGKKVAFPVVERTEQTNLAEVLIPMSLVLEFQARNMELKELSGIKMALSSFNFHLVDQISWCPYIGIYYTWEQTDLADVLIPMSSVLEVQARKCNPSSKLSKEELTSVSVSRSLGKGCVDHARALVDIRADRALKDTMVISVHNPVGNGCPKRIIVDLRNLGKHTRTYNDGFKLLRGRVPKSAFQKKTNSTPVSNSFYALEEDYGTWMMGRVCSAVYRRDDDPDEEDGYDETTHSSKSLGNSTSGNTSLEAEGGHAAKNGMGDTTTVDCVARKTLSTFGSY
ncbi:hypothetical protein Tco_0984014 [Tanacetum coccineum]